MATNERMSSIKQTATMKGDTHDYHRANSSK